MGKRIDKEYLKPQFKIFEKALKEWNYICLFIVFPWFIISHWGEGYFIALILGCIGPYAVGAAIYLPLRCIIPSYMAVRNVVMEDDEK